MLPFWVPGWKVAYEVDDGGSQLIRGYDLSDLILVVANLARPLHVKYRELSLPDRLPKKCI